VSVEELPRRIVTSVNRFTFRVRNLIILERLGQHVQLLIHVQRSTHHSPTKRSHVSATGRTLLQEDFRIRRCRRRLQWYIEGHRGLGLVVGDVVAHGDHYGSGHVDLLRALIAATDVGEEAAEHRAEGLSIEPVGPSDSPARSYVTALLVALSAGSQLISRAVQLATELRFNHLSDVR